MTDKERLWINIKLVATFYGECIHFTKEYAKDVYELYKHDLKRAIECFEVLLEQTKWMKNNNAKK